MKSPNNSQSKGIPPWVICAAIVILLASIAICWLMKDLSNSEKFANLLSSFISIATLLFIAYGYNIQKNALEKQKENLKIYREELSLQRMEMELQRKELQSISSNATLSHIDKYIDDTLDELKSKIDLEKETPPSSLISEGLNTIIKSTKPAQIVSIFLPKWGFKYAAWLQFVDSTKKIMVLYLESKHIKYDKTATYGFIKKNKKYVTELPCFSKILGQAELAETTMDTSEPAFKAAYFAYILSLHHIFPSLIKEKGLSDYEEYFKKHPQALPAIYHVLHSQKDKPEAQ